MNNQISTANQSQGYAEQSLASLIGGEILPALRAYYPASDFNWRGNLEQTATEYANQLFGMKFLVKEIRAALDLARLRSVSERHAPNPIEFKILCLQARGMPTLEQCMSEINEQRIKNYGKSKEWSEPLVYWLNQQIAAARVNLPDTAWQKMAKDRYTKLADKYGKNELSPIPLKIEHTAQPAYLKYVG